MSARPELVDAVASAIALEHGDPSPTPGSFFRMLAEAAIAAVAQFIQEDA